MNDDRVNLDFEFKFYTDTPLGKDPDSHSATLRRYHKILWSKDLPNGTKFELVDAYPNGYLCHKSDLGEFFLSSDSITHSYRATKRISHVIDQTPADIVNSLYDHGSTIGAFIIFPGKKIGRQPTINGARGLNPKIQDRFDITLECIRRHYCALESPLSDTLARYRSFFDLFQDFKGYVSFFLLQDLVAADYSSVRFHLPWGCFDDNPLPRSREEYLTYYESTINFITSRAIRMKDSL